MKRREFVTSVPAVAAGVAVGGSVGAAEASEGRGWHEGARGAERASGTSEGFVLLHEQVWSDKDIMKGRKYEVHRYVVQCPYPVGSKAWMALADRDEDGDVVVYDEWPKAVPVVSLRTRRTIFPRFVLGEGEDLRGRARNVYSAVVEQGFDDVRGPESGWKVVHVEYRCPDGVEHVMAGLPASWDSRLCLSVFVQGQVGGDDEGRRWWGQRSRIEQLEDALRAVLDGDSDEEIVRGVLGDDSWRGAFGVKGRIG